MKEEITFCNNEVTLKGTLTKPATVEPFPVVVAAHTSHAGTSDFGVYQHLARILSARGIAVLLFDRRGAGASTGEFRSATFFDLATDIQAAIDYLKLRIDVDRRCIGLWGMSQGGWIAPLTASNSTDVAFVIAVSAAAFSPAEQMDYSAEYQLREHGFSEKTIEQMLQLRGLVNEFYRGNVERFTVQKQLDLLCDEAWFLFAYLDDYLPEDPAVTKWYQEMDYDPIPIIQKTGVPVLLLYGEIDPWVPIDKSIARWQQYGIKAVTIREIKNANHFMISIAESGIRGDKGQIVEEYTTILSQWIKQQLDKKEKG